MIPLKDNVSTKTVPIITVTLILVNISIFIWMLSLGPIQERNLVARYAFIPREFTEALSLRSTLLPVNFMTIFSSMFLHGGLLHLIGNMLYLWIFGNNVEDVLGHGRFVGFYILSGAAAAVTQLSVDPVSPIPMIGASGAISGVLGAYLLLFPWARVKTLVFIIIFISVVDIPAVVLLTIWFFMQILFSQGQGIAWFAHIGGFIFGLITVRIFLIGKGGTRNRGRSTGRKNGFT